MIATATATALRIVVGVFVVGGLSSSFLADANPTSSNNNNHKNNVAHCALNNDVSWQLTWRRGFQAHYDYDRCADDDGNVDDNNNSNNNEASISVAAAALVLIRSIDRIDRVAANIAISATTNAAVPSRRCTFIAAPICKCMCVSAA